MAGWAAVGAAGASLAGDIFGMSSAKSQAASAREFQLRLAQHGVEMRMNDLKRAGLNPILAVTGGGGVGSASVGSPPTAQYAPRSGAQLGQLALLKSQMELNSAAAVKARAEAGEAEGRTLPPGVAEAVARAAAGLSSSSAARADQEVVNLQKGLGEIEARTKHLEEQARETGLSADLAARVQDYLVELERLRVAIEKLRVPQEQLKATAAQTVQAGVKPSEDALTGVGRFLGGKAADLRDYLEGLLEKYRNRPTYQEWQKRRQK